MTLEQFVQESGIQAFNALVNRCEAIGVQPPTIEEYQRIIPTVVSCQQDGVVVIEPLPIISESTGLEIDDIDVHSDLEMDPAPGEFRKKRNKKKEL
jgi:hypothetical protein